MENFELTTREFILYMAAFGAVVGLILGLLILYFGIKKGDRRTGLIGLLVAVVAGAISPILALVVVGIFFWLLRKRSNTSTISEPGDSPGSHTS
jgi:hypothetical protein